MQLKLKLDQIFWEFEFVVVILQHFKILNSHLVYWHSACSSFTSNLYCKCGLFQINCWSLFYSCTAHCISLVIPRCCRPGSFTDPSDEGLSRERARERDRSRPHGRRHHSSAGEKQRYYSCERYGSREQCHAKSAGPSRSTSPGEGQDVGLLKQV